MHACHSYLYRTLSQAVDRSVVNNRDISLHNLQRTYALSLDFETLRQVAEAPTVCVQFKCSTSTGSEKARIESAVPDLYT